MAIAAPKVKNPDDFHKSGIIFGIVVFLYQVMMCLFYAYWAGYSQTTTPTYFDQGEIQLVACLTILVLVGFGLCNAYITNASFSGMGFTLLIFGLTLEHWFLIRDFWQKAGVSDPNNGKYWGPSITKKISFVNYGQDRFDGAIGTSYAHETYMYSHYSFVDAIACALCNVIALGSVVGRIKLMGVFVLTLFGTFFQEVATQILWRLSIYDTGYGMRVFLFGGVMGFFASLVQGRKDTTINSPRYISVYASRGLGILGICVIFCVFPCLVAAGIFKTSPNRMTILYSSVLRMYLALVASILGSFTASALTYRKIFAHDLIFGAITGAIAYSSSADLHENPSIPLTVGFTVGLAMTIYLSVQLRKLNKNGVVVSLTTLERYVYPGIISGVVSAIVIATNQGSNGNYQLKIPANRTNIAQGGYQIAGICIVAAIALGTGLLLGLLFKATNKQDADQSFRDNEIFRPDFPPSVQYVSWKET